MLERFPKLRPGDHLTTRRVNKLGKVARDLAGSLSSGVRQVGSGLVSVPPPFHQRVVQLVDTPSDGAATADIKLCYFDGDSWEIISDSGTFELDLALFDENPENGDQLVAYWDPARSAFVPIVFNDQYHVIPAIASSVIAARAGRQYGLGPAILQGITNGLVADGTSVTVANPHEVIIPANTHIVVAKVEKSGGGDFEYVIIEVSQSTDVDSLPPSGYSSWETWKKTNIDNSLADEYGLSVCYGPFDLNTFSNDSTVGSRAWTDPGNAASSDNSRADAGIMPASGATTNYLKALELDGYSPHANFVPKAVHVTIERRDAGGSGAVTDNRVRLVVGDAVQSQDEASPVSWPSADGVMNYRFATTASRAQTLANDFGVVVSAVAAAGGGATATVMEPVNGITGFSAADIYGVGGSVSCSAEANPANWWNAATSVHAPNAVDKCGGGVVFPSAWTPDGKLISGEIEWGLTANLVSIGATLYLVALQSGTHYVYQLDIQTLPGSVLEPPPYPVTDTFTFANLTAADFTEIGTSNHPDFSAGAADVHFGFAVRATGVSVSGNTISSVFSISISTETPNNESRPQVDHIQVRVCGVVV